MANPDTIRNALTAINLLAKLQVQIIPVGALSKQKQSLIWGAENALLPIPIAFALGYAVPTGTLNRATFNADETTTISNPPTQAQVQAVQARLTETRQILAALISDLQRVGISPTTQ